MATAAAAAALVVVGAAKGNYGIVGEVRETENGEGERNGNE